MTLREARLTGSHEPEIPGGGIPLPGAYQVMVEHLLDNGRRAPAATLEKLVKAELELKTERVLRIWGSWGGFVEDMMAWLESKGRAVRDGDEWILSRHIVSGDRIYLPGDIRVVVRSREDRESMELYARARRRLLDYRQALEVMGLFEGKVAETFTAHLDSLHYEEEQRRTLPPPPAVAKQEELLARGVKPARGVVSKFVVKYVQEKGDWATIAEIVEEFTRTHGRKISSGTPHSLLERYHLEGKVDKKLVLAPKNRPAAAYRWIRQD